LSLASMRAALAPTTSSFFSPFLKNMKVGIARIEYSSATSYVNKEKKRIAFVCQFRAHTRVVVSGFPCIQRKVTYSSLININLGEDNIRELFGKLDELGADDLAGTAPLSVEVDSDLYEGKKKGRVLVILWLV